MAPEAVGAALERDVARVGSNPCGERDVGRQPSGEVEILTCHPAVVAQSAGRVFGVKIGHAAVYRAVQLREDVPAQVIVKGRALRVSYVLEGGIHGTGRGEVLPVIEILPAAAHDVAHALDAVVEEGVGQRQVEVELAGELAEGGAYRLAALGVEVAVSLADVLRIDVVEVGVEVIDARPGEAHAVLQP